VSLDPGFLADSVVGVQLTRQVPEMLAGVIEIDDLNRAGEVDIGQIPNPFGSVADDNLLLRAAPSAVPGFPTEASAELFGDLDGSGIGGRIGIANRETFFVMRRLSEYASQFQVRGVL